MSAKLVSAKVVLPSTQSRHKHCFLFFFFAIFSLIITAAMSPEETIMMVTRQTSRTIELA